MGGGTECSYGACDEDGSGVFTCLPRQCEAHSYRESIAMGKTSLSNRDVEKVLVKLCTDWRGSDYDLLHKNCCHFSQELCRQLGVDEVPPWVMSLAGAGAAVDD